MTAAAPCLAGLLSLCFFLLITVWVTPENQLAKLALRGSSVLPQDFRGPQMGFHFRWGGNAQFLCIIQLSETSGDFVDVVEHPTRVPTTTSASKVKHRLSVFIFRL